MLPFGFPPPSGFSIYINLDSWYHYGLYLDVVPKPHALMIGGFQTWIGLECIILGIRMCDVNGFSIVPGVDNGSATLNVGGTNP